MSTALFASLPILGHSFVLALMHSLWQAAILYIAAILLLRLLPASTARGKYILSIAALGTLVYWFADTWATQYQRLSGYTVFVSQPAVDQLPERSRAIHINVPGQDFELLRGLQVYVAQHFNVIMLVYCAGLLLMTARLLRGMLQLRRLRTRDIFTGDEHWIAFVNHSAERMGIGRSVQLFLSSRVYTPVMMGVVKPVILLPIATVNSLSVREVEAILLHELAHIRRHDYLLNLLQATIEVLLFFNPFVWLLSSIIRREREHCCDDIVVAQSAEPLIYAKALANLRFNTNTAALAQAATGRKNQLLNRIKRIMEMKTTDRNYGRVAIASILILGVVLTIAMLSFTPSFAQKAKKSPDADSTATHRIVKKTVIVDDNGKRTKKTTTTTTSADATDGDGVDVHVSFSDGTRRAHSLVDSGDVDQVVHDIKIASKDVASAMAEVGDELAAVDWDGVRAEIRTALAEVDRELDHSLKGVNIEVRKELEKGKAELARSKVELDNVRLPHGSVSRGDDGIEKMLSEMERDGLIDRSRKYKVEKEDGVLYINNKEQSGAVLQKYSSYLQHEHIAIKGDRGALAISIND
jgi:bla regulator protein BlaR1